MIANILQDESDIDSDGLTAYQEFRVYGTDPNLADTDGDKIKDGDEVGTIFDPTVDETATIQLLAANPELYLDLASSTDAVVPEVVITNNENGDFVVIIRVEKTEDFDRLGTIGPV